jgi:hypothetical protein
MQKNDAADVIGIERTHAEPVRKKTALGTECSATSTVENRPENQSVKTNGPKQFVFDRQGIESCYGINRAIICSGTARERDAGEDCGVTYLD